MSERLEEIKEKLVRWQTEEIESTNVDLWPKDIRDVEWLIEQAERAQELDDILEQDHRQEVLESMYDDNQRLKKRVQELESHITKMAIARYKDSEELDETHKQNERYQKILTLLNDKEKLATEIYKENENLVMFTPEQVIDSILRKIDRLESDEG